MADEERQARMARMRAVVKECNVYRWAGNLIGELAEIRLEPAKASQPKRRESLFRNNVIRFETKVRT
jgi:trehalose-6-phosphate synthase